VEAHPASSDGPISAHDDFSIEVTPRVYVPKTKPGKKKKKVDDSCPDGSDLTIASIILEKEPSRVDGVTRVSILRGFHMFFSVDADKVDLMTIPVEDLDASHEFIRSGPGNVVPSSKNRKNTAFALQWLVGCDGYLWKSSERKLKEVAESAKGGLLATILMNTDVSGWHVSVVAPNFRVRRQMGSGFGPDTSSPGKSVTLC
jgi:hypothetical protein